MVRFTGPQRLVSLSPHLCHLQLRRYTGQQFVGTERFRQIAVSPSWHALDAAVLTGAYCGANRPPIPIESGQAFRGNPATHSG